MDTDGAGGNLGDYFDYVRDAYTKGKSYMVGPGWGLLQGAYDMAYDNSHGSDRYWLSQVPVFSWMRNKRDQAQEAQDRYDNTGIDELYINRVAGFDAKSIYGGAGGSLGITRMSSSLSQVYSPEVVEDVSKQFNNSYW